MIDKLQKLLAMEQSARAIGNQAEAEAFASKIQELCFKFNLTMSDLEVEEQERDEPIDREWVRDIVSGGRQDWLETLSQACASSCFCRRLVISGSSTQVFLGRTSDRKAAAMLFTHLATSAIALSKSGFKAIADRNPYEYPDQRSRWGREWRKSFLKGFSRAIFSRLNVERNALTEGDNAAALVLRKDRAIQEFIDGQKIGQARQIGSKASVSGGYWAGHEAGSRISTVARHALK